MELSDPKIAQLDLAYHDLKRGRGVFDLLQRKGLAARITTDVSPHTRSTRCTASPRAEPYSTPRSPPPCSPVPVAATR